MLETAGEGASDEARFGLFGERSAPSSADYPGEGRRLVIFKPELCDLALSGRKTVTRRPGKVLFEGDEAIQPCRYRQGHTYAIQPGRGKQALGRLRIDSVELQPLSDGLLPDEARREGFPDPDAFRAYWERLYGNFDRDLAVWRIGFRLASTPEES